MNPNSFKYKVWVILSIFFFVILWASMSSGHNQRMKECQKNNSYETCLYTLR